MVCFLTYRYGWCLSDFTAADYSGDVRELPEEK
ncbi:MAG: hypothetical protein ACD_75C00186G0001, partial [uncultured bacterium]